MDKSGNRIRSLRLENRMSQRQLAKLLEMHPATLSRYENNIQVFGWDSLRRIASTLNTSADYLLCITDIKTPIKDILYTATNKRLDLNLFEKFSKLDQGRQIALLESTNFLIDHEVNASSKSDNSKE